MRIFLAKLCNPLAKILFILQLLYPFSQSSSLGFCPDKKDGKGQFVSNEIGAHRKYCSEKRAFKSSKYKLDFCTYGQKFDCLTITHYTVHLFNNGNLKFRDWVVNMYTFLKMQSTGRIACARPRRNLLVKVSRYFYCRYTYNRYQNIRYSDIYACNNLYTELRMGYSICFHDRWKSPTM